MSIEDFIEDIFIPALEKLGFANWDRNELTDLSLRMALVSRASIDLTKEEKAHG